MGEIKYHLPGESSSTERNRFDSVSMFLSLENDNGIALRQGRRVKRILKPSCKYWEAGNEICLKVLIGNGIWNAIHQVQSAGGMKEKHASSPGSLSFNTLKNKIKRTSEGDVGQDLDNHTHALHKNTIFLILCGSKISNWPCFQEKMTMKKSC